MLGLTGFGLSAAPLVTFDSPIGFFTNVASRLLSSELGMHLTNIQIYPTNQYTPAVHRILQFTANLYDAGTNRTFGIADMTNGLGFPTVFRPLFTNTVDAQGQPTVFINGYSEVTNAGEMLDSSIVWHELNDTNEFTTAWQTNDMVYGFPLVIGAKKGWPNFNEFAMQTHLQLIRKLQFLRLGADIGTSRVSRTNQMYMLSISNTCGIEAWNSYSNDFNRPLWLAAAIDVMPLLTNENQLPLVGTGPIGSLITTNNGLGTNINSWTGFPLQLSGNWRDSFQVPLQSSFWILTNSEYSQLHPQFISPPTGQFENPSLFPAPHWWLRLITRVRYVVVDTASNRILDYVNLSYTRDPFDISWALMGFRYFGNTPYSLPSPNLVDEDEWSTNHWSIGSMHQTVSDVDPTFGILNQVFLCRGLTSPDPAQGWKNYAIDPQFGGDTTAAIDFFKFQFGLGSSDGTYGRSNVFYAPFSPVGVINFNVSWQANDPLVHHTVSDLTDSFSAVSNVEVLRITSPSPMADLGGNTPLNPHYRPWNGNPFSSFDITRYNLAVKDPLLSRSDYWNFPTSADAGLSWLGNVHRGTPWQTLYLKSPSIDLFTWTNWLGVKDPQVATAMHPTNDWHIAGLLATLLTTNRPVLLASVNQPSSAAWESLLDGMNVVTNSGNWQYFTTLVMSSNSVQAGVIGTGLATKRTTQPGGNFMNVGDILATPELSVASPWLNTNALPSLGASDEAYEAVPSQLLPMLRPDSFGSLAQNNGAVQVQFTGFDDWSYAMQTSTDLQNWVTVSTNSPLNGTFVFQDSTGAGATFYRSALLP